MGENGAEGAPKRSRRASVFWPLVLIAVGLLFLLNNVGVIEGSFWDIVFRIWPLLLIVLGLEGLLNRTGMVSAALLAGLGVVFLLANFGLLEISVWQLIFLLWPLFLIALGFDILIGRRSLLFSLLGILAVLAILAGTVWFVGSAQRANLAGGGRQIQQDLEDASRASVTLAPGVGTLRVTRLVEPVALVMGTVPAQGVLAVDESFAVEDGQAVYELHSRAPVVSFPGPNLYYWDLGLTDQIPMALDISLGAGDISLDLERLDLSDLQISTGVGQVTVALPAESSFDASISTAVGELVIISPEGLGLRLRADTALVVIEAPDGYLVNGKLYTSPDYASADDQVYLIVNQAIGRVVIREE